MYQTMLKLPLQPRWLQKANEAIVSQRGHHTEVDLNELALPLPVATREHSKNICVTRGNVGVVGRYVLNDTCEVFNRLIGKDYRIHLRHLPASFCNGFGDELASLFNGVRFFSAFQRADAFIDGR